MLVKLRTTLVPTFVEGNEKIECFIEVKCTNPNLLIPKCERWDMSVAIPI